jgi:Leucine-rich repeat (LRR) protein
MRVIRLAVCLLLFGSLAANAAIPASERDALIALYEATAGTAWTDRSAWLGAPGTECSWFGVNCDETGAAVVSLSLPYNNLVGALPSKLANLTKLRYLDLGDNALTGTLGPEITSLANLEILYLGRNGIGGVLPAAIGSLTKLRILALDGNEFEGAVPASIGQLTALEELYLHQNRFTALPSSIGSLLKLTALDAEGNRLEGSIPKELGSLVALELLYLQGNQLSGPIPAELRTMTALRDLDLSYNQLSGPIPAALGDLARLEEIDLSANRLSGAIPKELGNLSNLRLLGLYSNALTGTIPVELYRLRTLQELWLAANALTGTIPDGIAALTSLQYLSVEGNQLSGPIPKELGSLSGLVSLWLSENQFSGPIPPELMNLRNLQSLSLASNPLSGPLPATIANLVNLEDLFVYNAGLSGTIPRELGQLKNLEMLYAGGNAFEGTIPSELAALTKLTALHFGDNRLSGPIPTWIGDLSLLTELVLGYNQFSGPFPSFVTKLTALENLDLAGNRLTGTIPSDIGALKNLVYLAIGGNFLDGEIPPGLWTLTNLVDLRLYALDLTGPLAPEIGNLTKLEYLELGDAGLTGSIPPQIGNLTALQYLYLDVNRFTGRIPREIGALTNLRSLDLSLNALAGPVPAEILQLTALEAASSDFDYNALYTADPAIASFMDSKQYDGDFRGTQTVVPQNLRIVSSTDRSMVAAWTPIPFVDGDGGYRLTATPAGGGSAKAVTVTASKEVESAIIRGLQASTTYTVTVAALSYPNGWQKNLVASEESTAVAGTTGAPIVMPADIDVTSGTKGLIQIDGVPANEDSFTLTNFGDVATALTLQQNGTFFTVEPAAFTLNGGASQVVTVRSKPSPVEWYWGDVWPKGAGVPEELYIPVTLLSVARPAGTVVAEAVAARLEITGEPGTNSLGTARFRNAGTAPLTGVVVSDVPWLVPATEPIRIAPGEIGSVNFTVMRARRPEGAAEGALTGVLTLVYVDGSLTGSAAKTILTTTGVSRTLVTVVDIPKPKVAVGTIPALAAGEVAFFAPGVTSAPGVSRSLVSDVAIANAYATKAVDDLKVYYSKVASSQVAVATIAAIAADTAVTLANIIPNVYGGTGTEVGTLQLRSNALDGLVVTGRLLNLAAGGSGLIGELPIIRSDRAARAGETIVLTGLSASATRKTHLFIQETSGVASSARIEMFDAAGGSVAPPREVALAPFGTAEIADAVPAAAVTGVVTNVGSGGRIAAYARISDTASGDIWSVVDWTRNRQTVFRTAALHVPGVASSQGGPTRRRPVRRQSTGPAAEDATAGLATELWVNNPSSTEAVVEIAFVGSNGSRRALEVVLPARSTKSWPDAVGTLSGGSGAGSLAITPRRGSVVATARLGITEACGNCGAVLPVVPAGSGLRSGQRQRFSGIESASAATIAARKAGTSRTGFGIVETSGASVKVRASVKLADGRVASVLHRDIAVGANSAVAFDDLAAELYGPSRGEVDLHDLQVDFEVVEGNGAAVVYLTSTDNATGDMNVRVE